MPRPLIRRHSSNWVARAEYLHYDFEKSQFTFPLANRRFDDRSSKDTVKIGVNWRLNWGN